VISALARFEAWISAVESYYSFVSSRPISKYVSKLGDGRLAMCLATTEVAETL
jgi:hypothetical protein